MASRFARDLRHWRERRRISQLELALRAGTTQRHVSFIERGRSLPGRGMIVRLAESLELPLRERNDLLLAGGYAPAYPETPIDDVALEPVMGALRRMLDAHDPYPAVVIDRRGTIVARNAALDVMTEGAAPELLAPPVNAMRLALHPQGMAPRVVNFTPWAGHVIQALRREAARNPDPSLDALLAELEEYVPPAPSAGPDHLGFAVPLHLRASGAELRLVTTLTTFATAVDVTVSELRLEAFLPVDGTTAAHLAERRRRARRC
jgi:transcriptional regulator with XRE-family HTH domain